MKPYYQQGGVSIYHGNALEIAPQLGRFELVMADPPYGDTSLDWDRWPQGWPSLMLGKAPQMWMFGSLRMLLKHGEELAGWRMAQDIVWEKHNGTGMQKDRFRRVHELVVHFYQGKWGALPLRPPVVQVHEARPRRGLVRSNKPQHWAGVARDVGYDYKGTRLQRSVIKARNCHHHALHPTQKPEKILAALLGYSVPVGGSVLDPFAGSGSTLLAARALGLWAVGIERDEAFCEVAARRLEQTEMVLR
jgi:site-specific DNA-methyltransferase (adenine-specific)